MALPVTVTGELFIEACVCCVCALSTMAVWTDGMCDAYGMGESESAIGDIGMSDPYAPDEFDAADDGVESGDCECGATRFALTKVRPPMEEE